VIVQTDVNRISDNPDVTVTVEAFKWNWKFSYDGTTGADGEPVYTVGTSTYVPVLVLPTNKRVRFVLQGRDVIHSFWVPELLFKRDVFPGSVRNKFDVTLDRAGRYVGRCAELCGTYHAFMQFELVVVSPERFDQFLEAKRGGADTPAAMEAIGFTGDQRFATTTRPFDTRRQGQSWNKSGSAAAPAAAGK
jgi:cytochrome c oxidase subunit 2